MTKNAMINEVMLTVEEAIVTVVWSAKVGILLQMSSGRRLEERSGVCAVHEDHSTFYCSGDEF